MACLALSARAEDRAPGADPAPLDEIVVFGVRTGEVEGEPTAFGEVLQTDDYEAEGKDLSDLLSEQAGVFVRRFGGAGDLAELSIRGSTAAQVVVAIDGVRANSALTGGLDLSRVCLPLVERIEIARGAGATREGSGALGGVVDLVTRSGSEEPLQRVGGGGGAFETFEGSLFRAAAAGPLDYSLGYCGLATEGDFEFSRPEFIGPDGVPSPAVPEHATRINNERRQHGATLGLGGELGPGALRFGDFFVHSRGGEPGLDDGTPGEGAGQNPRADSRDWSNLAQLRYETQGLMPAHDGMRLGLYHRYEDSDFHDPLQANFGDPVDVHARLATLGARAGSTWQLPLGPLAQQLGLELDGLRDDFHSDEQPSRARSSGAFRVSDELSLWDGRVLLVPALRGEATEGFDFEWIPAVGVVGSPFDWLRLRANAGRAFRVPNFDELYHPDQGYIRGNPDLAPEDAWNFDAGFELVLAQLGPLADLRLVAAYFRREIDESIVWVPVNNITIASINTGDATAQGVELSLALRLTDYLRVALNHTELDSERDATGKSLPGQPERESFARVQLGPPQRWKLIGEWQRTDDLLVNEGGGRYLPSRTVWNASAAYDVASLSWLPLDGWLSDFWIFVEGNNLSDEAVRDTLAFPQPGRNLGVGFEATW